jgi:hypothetical protein
MDVKVLSQPYRDSGSAQTFITTALEDPAVRDVWLVTAWLSRSGVELLVPGLEEVRKRKGTTRLLFGVDFARTSVQGVSLARECVGRTYVVCDPASRIFHPKMYLATGDRVGYVLIGSNNLTAAGLWRNYEGALVAIFDPRKEPAMAEGVRAYAKLLLGDKGICKLVTDQVFARLVAERWLVDEGSTKWREGEDGPVERRRRLKSSGWGEPLFTSSTTEKRQRPAPVQRRRSRRVPSRTRRDVALAPDTWWKRLGSADAQRPPAGHPTGHVTLTDVPRHQDRPTFFRKVFFAGEQWQRRRRKGETLETAEIDADVSLGGDERGRHRLTALYQPSRRFRGRATTVLRWGPGLIPDLRKRDVTGWYLLIERANMRTYRISITPNRPA